MDLVSIARNPVPTGAISGYFTAKDGTQIRYAHWRPTGVHKYGTICLYTGRGEFIEKYYEVIADLRRRGFAVAIMDWRGQGGSSRALRNKHKGYVERFEHYCDDVEIFMRTIVLPDCPPPYFALAHSMGGHIMLKIARKPNCWYQRMVLVAPMISLAQEGIPVSQTRAVTFTKFLSAIGMGKFFAPGTDREPMERADFKDNVLTSDQARFERNAAIIEHAPELGLGGATIGWVHAALKSMRELAQRDYPESVKVPILIVAAGNDTVVSTRAIEDFTSRLKAGSHVVIPGARHEILQERDELRRQFWAAFDAYILPEGVYVEPDAPDEPE